LHEEEDVAFLLVTHSREVASFADRSLELREGRFIAQHGNDVDIADLSSTRALIIDETGTLTLPPEILTQLGGPGRFDIDADGDSLTMSRADERDPDDNIAPVNLTLAAECPACKYVYTDDAQECPSCGSSRPMVPV
jgi:ABC-type sulfate/molybdate transport systems ATPase subunit